MRGKTERKSQIIQQEQLKLNLYSRNGKDNIHFKFQKWFMDNAKLYTKVNEKLSKKISEKIDANVKECYHNCFKALYINGLQYCEGLVIDKEIGVPLEHSWLVDSRGYVVDPTLIISGKKLTKQMKKYGIKSSEGSRIGSEYYGVKYTKEQVNKFALKTKKTGAFLYLLYQEANK